MSSSVFIVWEVQVYLIEVFILAHQVLIVLQVSKPLVLLQVSKALILLQVSKILAIILFLFVEELDYMKIDWEDIDPQQDQKQGEMMKDDYSQNYRSCICLNILQPHYQKKFHCFLKHLFGFQIIDFLMKELKLEVLVKVQVQVQVEVEEWVQVKNYIEDLMIRSLILKLVHYQSLYLVHLSYVIHSSFLIQQASG